MIDYALADAPWSLPLYIVFFARRLSAAMSESGGTAEWFFTNFICRA
jgi:hypothetical protein